MAPPPSSTLLPPYVSHLADLYDAYILPNLPDPLYTMSTYITPFLSSGLSAASNADMVSLAAFLVVVYLTLRIADYVRRSVVAWVIFLVKIALIAAVVNAAFYVNSVGLNKSLKDAEWLLGIVWGLVEDRFTNSGNSGRDNRTGWSSNNNPWGAYGGGARQQVPIGRGGRKRNGGWT
jgi:hypothetical protein